MSELKLALPTIFLHEGKFINDPRDPGWATNFGISLRFLVQTGDLDGDGFLDGDINHDGKIDIKDILAISQDDAAHLYDLYFWSKYRYGLINCQPIATKVFDLAINMGASGSHKCLQRAARSVNPENKLADDGILGAKTLDTINRSKSDCLLAALKSEAAGFYRSIRLKSNNEQTFIKGWLNRAYSDMVVTKGRSFEL